MHVAKMDDLQDTPSSYPEDSTTPMKITWLENLCNQMLQFVWLPYDSKSIQEAKNAYQHADDGCLMDCPCLEGMNM
jgi:hypothetical protein